MWIDTHTHLNDQAYQEDYRVIISSALAQGVQAMIVVGFDLFSSNRAIELAKENEMVWAAVGVHPHDAKSWDQQAANQLIQMMAEPKVVAVGEIGLDYHYNYSPKALQLLAFKEQIQIAQAYNKPVIIHNREAHQDTLALLMKEKVGSSGGVMHCFSSSWEMAKQCLELGLFISFAGPLTFPKAENLHHVAREVPLDRVLIETDCPYLSPHPLRGRRNEPARVLLVGEKLAELKKISVQEMMEITVKNSKSLFKI